MGAKRELRRISKIERIKARLKSAGSDAFAEYAGRSVYDAVSDVCDCLRCMEDDMEGLEQRKFGLLDTVRQQDVRIDKLLADNSRVSANLADALADIEHVKLLGYEKECSG